jgi:hypothetical protein
MKTKNTGSGIRWVGILVLLLAPIMVGSAYAQEKEKKSDDVYRVEIKDGKLYVDGELIKEFKDKTRGFVFSSDDEEIANTFAFFSDDDDGHTGRMYTKRPNGKVWKMDIEGDEDSPVVGRVRMRSRDGGRDVLFGDGEMEVEIEGSEWSVPMMERMEMMRQRVGEYGRQSTNSMKIGKMEREARGLAKKVRKAEDADKAELESKLDKLLTDIFDLKMEDQQKRVDKMTRELEKLRSRISEREASRTDIIEKRHNQLLGVKDLMEW